MMSNCMPIDGFSNYMACGEGYLINRSTGKELRGCKTKSGYLHTSIISDSGPSKFVYIHRVIAEAFLPKQKSGHLEVNHKDGDKTNNNVKNLEWVTSRENKIHAVSTGLRKVRRVSATHMETGEKLYFESTRKAAEHFGISASHICMCCKGRRPYANGYFWKYEQEGSGDE